MGKPNYYQRNRDVLLNKSKEHYRNITDEQKQRYREDKKHKYHSMTDEDRQKYKEYQKNYRKNMSDEQKQRYREGRNKKGII